MTNKQIMLLFLAFTLVALFCATGVFAEEPVLVLSQTPTMAMKASNYQYWYKTLDDNPAYICTYVDGNYTKMVIGSPFNSGYGFSTSENGTYQTRSYNSAPSDGIYYGEVSNQTSTVQIDNTPHYSSFSACIQAISEYFGSTQARADVYSAVVPAGWALVVRPLSEEVIDITDIEINISNSWNFPQVSGSSSRYNGARFGLLANSAIVQDASADGISLITWTATNANIFGRASSYSFTASNRNASNGFSYVFTNPLYGGSYVQSDGGGFNQNTDMTVKVYYSHVGDVEFDLVALRAALTADSGVFTYNNFFDPLSGDITGSFVPDPDGGDGGTVDFGTPQEGGGNADQPPLSENTTIFGILSTLTNTITDLFTRAGDAMHSLVQASNSFFSSVLSFFGWLPAEWSAVLWSFFIILTVFGVVKLFL